MPPPEAPRHKRASLGQSLMGSLLFSPGSWWAQGSVCTIPESVFPVLCKFWWLYGGLMVTSSKKAYAIPRSVAPRASAPEAGHCWPIPPLETFKHSSVSVSMGSLSPGVHKVCLSRLGVSGGYEFDSKGYFAPPTILLELLLCPWMWGVCFWWDPTVSCWWLFSSEL